MTNLPPSAYYGHLDATVHTLDTATVLRLCNHPQFGHPTLKGDPRLGQACWTAGDMDARLKGYVMVGIEW